MKTVLFNSFYFNPKLDFLWNLNIKNKLSLSLSHNTTPNNSIDLLDNFLLQGFRSFSRGISLVNQFNSSNIYLEL